MKLFTGIGCMPCKQVKEWLAAHNIEVENIIAADNLELATSLGVKRLPTLVLDDNTTIAGPEDIIEYFEGGEDE